MKLTIEDRIPLGTGYTSHIRDAVAGIMHASDDLPQDIQRIVSSAIVTSEIEMTPHVNILKMIKVTVEISKMVANHLVKDSHHFVVEDFSPGISHRTSMGFKSLVLEMIESLAMKLDEDARSIENLLR